MKSDANAEDFISDFTMRNGKVVIATPSREGGGGGFINPSNLKACDKMRSQVVLSLQDKVGSSG